MCSVYEKITVSMCIELPSRRRRLAPDVGAFSALPLGLEISNFGGVLMMRHYCFDLAVDTI